MLIRRDGNISHLFISLATQRSMGEAFISSGFVPTITKPTRITHTCTTATLIGNAYVKMRHPEELESGVISVDMSDNLPIFT